MWMVSLSGGCKKRFKKLAAVWQHGLVTTEDPSYNNFTPPTRVT